MQSEKQDLVQAYLQICQKAIEANSARFPFQQILSAAKNIHGPRRIKLVITDACADQTRDDVFAMIVEYDGQNKAPRLLPCPADDKIEEGLRRTWAVRQAYLQEVVDNPVPYIDNPALLDWQWLYDLA